MLTRSLSVIALAALAGVASQPAFAVKVPVTGLSEAIDDDPLRTIETVSFSPDGQQLLILGNLTSGTEVDYAYTVPLTGGTPTKVSDGTADVDDYPVYTADGLSIVYTADVGDINNLVRVPAGGGPAVTITTEPVSFARLTPDGQTAVFLTPLASDAEDILKAVPVAGGAVTQLTSAVEGDTDTDAYFISPDGSSVVFGSTFLNRQSTNEDSLFQVPVDGSAAPSLIDFGPVAPHIIDIRGVRFDANGDVVFVTDYSLNNNYNLHTLPITGGTAQTLPDFPIPAAADVRDFEVSPDGKYIAFSSDLREINVFDLFVVPITGGTPVMVSDPITAEAIDTDITGDGIPDISDGNVDGDLLDAEGAIAWSPDSRQIAYVADTELDGVFQLHLVDNLLFEALPGDYNFDGLVNAADYTVWRDTDGSTTDLRADGDGSGAVDQLDYDFWVTNYGGPADLSLSIPEPSGALVLGGVVLTYLLAPRSKRLSA